MFFFIENEGINLPLRIYNLILGSMRALIMVLKHPIGGPEEEMLP